MEFNNEVTFRTRFEKGVYLLERLGEAEGLMHFCQKALIGQASALDEWAYLSLTIIALLGREAHKF